MTFPGGTPLMRPDQSLQPLSRAGSGPAPQQSVIVARQVIITGPGDRLLVYSPAVGANNLVYSISAAAATDPFGNQILAGATSYGSGFGLFFAVQINGSRVLWYIGGATQSVAYTQTVGLAQSALNPGVTLQSAVTAGPSFGIADGGLSGQIRQLWIAPSGDATGATDPANVQAAINVVTSPTTNSVVNLLPGTWTGNTAVNLDFGQYVIGGGYGNTIWNFVGTGDAFRQTHAGAYSAANIGGGVLNMTIDGSGAGAGSSGIHAGDIESLNYDGTRVQNFSGAGSIGYHFDNTTAFTERMTGTLRSTNNTAGVVFDVSGATTSTNSFARALLTIYVSSGGVTHNGVVLQNGALVYDSNIKIFGNFTTGASGSPGAVLTITGTVPAGHPGAGTASRLLRSEMQIGVETGTGVVIPQSVNFGASANFIDGFGLLDFGTSNLFTVSNIAATGSQFRWAGRVEGEASLVSTAYYGTNPAGAIVNNSLLLPNSGGNVSVNPAGAVTGIRIGAAALDGQQFTIVNLSGNLVTFDVAGTSNVAGGVGATVPANTNRLFIWNAAAALWFGGL